MQGFCEILIILAKDQRSSVVKEGGVASQLMGLLCPTPLPACCTWHCSANAHRGTLYSTLQCALHLHSCSCTVGRLFQVILRDNLTQNWPAMRRSARHLVILHYVMQRWKMFFWQIWSGLELAAGRLLWRSWKDFIACVTETSLWQTLSRLIQTVVELHFKQVALHLYPVRKKSNLIQLYGRGYSVSEYNEVPWKCSERKRRRRYSRNTRDTLQNAQRMP